MIRVDRQSLIALVATDERLDRIEAACAAQGTTLGPVSDVKGSATLADALTARGGRRSPRYGELWDRVLSLEADFPGEKRLVTKGAPRAATGPDVTRTVLEARGKLGTVKKVQLRLKTTPRERSLVRATAIDLAHALLAARAVLHAGALAAEVTLDRRDGQPAQLSLLFEGDPLLVAADLVLTRRALAGSAGVFTDEAPPHYGGDVHAATGNGIDTAPLLSRSITASWSNLSSLLAPADTGHLVAIAHEGATLALAPGGAAKAEPLSLADVYLARIAAALARRCS